MNLTLQSRRDRSESTCRSRDFCAFGDRIWCEFYVSCDANPVLNRCCGALFLRAILRSGSGDCGRQEKKIEAGDAWFERLCVEGKIKGTAHEWPQLFVCTSESMTHASMRVGHDLRKALILLKRARPTASARRGSAPSSPRAFRAPFGSAALALRSGALTARTRPGCWLGSACAQSAARRLQTFEIVDALPNPPKSARESTLDAFVR